MDASVADALAVFGFFGTFFALLLAILWILVPFAIFGIKPLLRDLIYQQQRTNTMLTSIITGLRDGKWPDERIDNRR